jgi:hypothetical protein
MELEHIRIQPQDFARALWDHKGTTEQAGIDAWLRREFQIEEPFVLLEPEPRARVSNLNVFSASLK